MELASLLPLIAIALLFWLFIIRPASKRQRDVSRMQSSLGEGDQIMLTSGIHGTVRRVEDDHLVLEIADGVDVKVARGAVGSILAPAAPPAEEPEDHDEPGGASDTQEGN